jgi:CheY-like chemotaxis protein
MPRVRVFHFKEAEAGPLLSALRTAKHTIEYSAQTSTALFQAIRAHPPDVFVIDMNRAPSHGRYVAIFIRQSPKTRSVPVVFVDGDAEKLAKTREVLPDCEYTTLAKLPAAIRKAIGNKPAAPVVPRHVFSVESRTSAQKMGISKGTRVAVIDPPAGYERAIGAVPEGVEFVEEDDPSCPMTLWFVRDPDDFLARLPRMRARAAKSRLWVLWPKGGTTRSGAITQPLIREAAIEMGMVDYKICSVDKTWSGIALTIKKAR